MPPLITIIPYFNNGTNVSPVPVDPPTEQPVNVGGSFSTDFSNSGSISIPHDGSFDFGTEDYTIEGWIRPGSNNSGAHILDMNMNNSVLFKLYLTSGSASSRYLRAQVFSNAVNVNRTSANRVTAGSWHHFVLCRSGGQLRFFVNGQRQITVTDAQNHTTETSRSLIIGSNAALDSPYVGQISNLRIIKGYALYPDNADHVLPSKNLLPVWGTELLALTSDTEVKDLSPVPKPFTIAGTVVGSTETPPIAARESYGSLNFDGASYLYLSSGSIPSTINGSDFTIEFFLRTDSVNQAGNAKGIIMDLRSANVVNGLVITMGGYSGSTTDVLRLRHSLDLTIYGTTVIADDQWHHCAITREGSTVRLFVDGNLEASGTDPDPISIGSQRPVIGANGFEINGGTIGNNPVYFEGKLSNVRITNGRALYTANFTKQDLPLGISRPDTQLLALTSATSIDQVSDNAAAFTLVGAASLSGDHPFTTVTQVSAGGVKIGEDAAADFTGTGAITLVNDGGLNLFGDYTIEFWVYLKNDTDPQTIIDFNYGILTGSTESLIKIVTRGGTGGVGTQLRAVLIPNQSSGGAFITSTALTTNTWYHFAVSRKSSYTRIYINGNYVARSNASGARADYFAERNTVHIGSNADGTNAFEGKISNLRIINGESLYYDQNNPVFDVPTRPFSSTQKTELLAFAKGTEVSDISGNLTMVAPVGVTAETSGPSLTPVSSFGSMEFTNGIAYVSSGALTSPLSGNYTFIEMWIKTDSTNVEVVADFRPQGTPSGLIFSIGHFDTDGTTEIDLGKFVVDISGTKLISSEIVADNNWHHIAVSKIISSFYLYIDGEHNGNVSVSSSITIGANRPVLGANGFDFNGTTPYSSSLPLYFTGKIAEFAIHGQRIRLTPTVTEGYKVEPFPSTLYDLTESFFRVTETEVIDIRNESSITVATDGGVTFGNDHPFTGLGENATTDWSLGATATGASSYLLIKDTQVQTQDYMIEVTLYATNNVPDCGIGLYDETETAVDTSTTALRASFHTEVFNGTTDLGYDRPQGTKGDVLTMEVRFSNATTAEVKFYDNGFLMHTEPAFDMTNKRNTLWGVWPGDKAVVTEFKLL